MKYLCRECNSIWEDNQVDGKCLDCGSFELIVIEKDYKETVKKLRGMLREAKEIEDQELIEILSKKINKLGQLKVKRDLKNKTTMQILEKINHDMEYHIPEEIFPVYQIRFNEIKKRLENCVEMGREYEETQREFENLIKTIKTSYNRIVKNKRELTIEEISTSQVLSNIYIIAENLDKRVNALNK